MADKRLTVKDPNNIYCYCGDADDEIDRYFELTQALGKLEDVLEKYGIDNVQELDAILSHYKYLGDHNFQTLPKEDFDALFKELSKYKALEDGLGISLETLFKALTNGYLRRGVNLYGCYDNRYKVVRKVQRYDCGIDLRKKCLYEKGYNRYDQCYRVYFSDYGTTWTLEEEGFR